MSSTPSISEAQLQRWLAAESQDRPEAEREAEAALMELFAALPLHAPSAGFAGRVLRQVGFPHAAPRARRDLFAGAWVRGLLAAGLGAVALGVLALPTGIQVLYRLGGLLTFGDLIQGGIHFGTEALVALVAALRLGSWMVSVGRALTLPLLTPEASGALVACLIVSGASLYALRDLISRQRSWNYVDS